MLQGILGTKVGMTHLFTEEGKMVPVTVIQAGPVYVTQIKKDEEREVKDAKGGVRKVNDGYNAIQVGYGVAKEKKLFVIGDEREFRRLGQERLARRA